VAYAADLKGYGIRRESQQILEITDFSHCTFDRFVAGNLFYSHVIAYRTNPPFPQGSNIKNGDALYHTLRIMGINLNGESKPNGGLTLMQSSDDFEKSTPKLLVSLFERFKQINGIELNGEIDPIANVSSVNSWISYKLRNSFGELIHQGYSKDFAFGVHDTISRTSRDFLVSQGKGYDYTDLPRLNTLGVRWNL
jgi:hypothetical protein